MEGRCGVGQDAHWKSRKGFELSFYHSSGAALPSRFYRKTKAVLLTFPQSTVAICRRFRSNGVKRKKKKRKRCLQDASVIFASVCLVVIFFPFISCIKKKKKQLSVSLSVQSRRAISARRGKFRLLQERWSRRVALTHGEDSPVCSPPTSSFVFSTHCSRAHTQLQVH